MDAVVTNPHHAGVRQAAQTLDLAPDARQQHRIGQPHRLQGRLLARGEVPRAEHDTHAAFAERAEDLVGSDDGPGG
jgi:hypothetical protein